MQTSATTPSLLNEQTRNYLVHVQDLFRFSGRRLLVVRHGRTTKPGPGEDDDVRVLTKKGHEQCRKAREGWFAPYTRHPAILHTSAQRAWQTASALNLTGGRIEVEGMYPFNEPIVDEIYKAEGNVPLGRYFGQGWDPNPWLQRALDGLIDVSKRMLMMERPDDEPHVLVSHGCFAPALVWAFAIYWEVNPSLALSIKLGEVEGLHVSSRGVQHLTLPG